LHVTETPPVAAVPPPVIPDRPAADRIEISFPDGTRLQVGSDVSLTALSGIVAPWARNCRTARSHDGARAWKGHDWEVLTGAVKQRIPTHRLLARRADLRRIIKPVSPFLRSISQWIIS
ncbi:MAG TPA: hypothetical protein VGM32_03690, partial [Rhodopila sp.]